jgi:hypothetical protein
VAPMTATLPEQVQRTFERFITTEYTTVDRGGNPITWPVTPYYRAGDPHVDLTTGLGYPKKADDARRNPRVSLLFSDPTGCGLERPPAVLVQGTADVDDRDLRGNRDRYYRESVAKLPGTKSMMPPKLVQGFFDWYFTRIYVHVRPERVYVWHEGDFGREPQLYDSRIEEVRSGHSEEPEEPKPGVAGGPTAWDRRIEELGSRHKTAVVSIVAPDGFPMSARVPIALDQGGGRVRLLAEPVGVPLAPGRACLTAHEHDPEFKWQSNFQVRGDLVRTDGEWSLVPHRLVGGFEMPPTSMLARYRLNAKKVLRFRSTAKREFAKRAG